MNAIPVLSVVMGLALIAPTHIEAQEVDTVQNFVLACDRIGVDSGYCTGYVAGIAAMMTGNCSAMRAGYGGAPGFAAAVESHTYGAMVQAFRNWARDNPQDWGLPAVNGIIKAMVATFPCDAAK